MNKNNIISDWLDKYGEPEIDKKVGIKLEKMNKQKYYQIIDEVYGNYISYIHDIVQVEHHIYGNWYGKKEFINKCKTDPEFSEKWGLKIEEQELNTQERNEWFQVHLNGNNPFMKSDWKDYELDQQNIPTKQITLTYDNEIIEIFA